MAGNQQTQTDHILLVMEIKKKKEAKPRSSALL